jgi:hypothetical protein
MSTPYRDPLRPLLRASILARILAVGMICVGILHSVAAVQRYRFLSDDYNLVYVALAVSAAVMLLVGVACFIAGAYMRLRKSWAILLGLIIASLMLCLIGYSMWDMGLGNVRNLPPPMAIALGFALGFALMLVELIRGFRALRRDPSVVHGFVPLVTAKAVEHG